MSQQKIYKRVVYIALFTFVAFLLYSLLPTPYFGGHTVFAQEPSADQINEVAKYLNCPTCAGINLADCRTTTCAQWKEQISDLLQEGYSEQEVLDYFVTQYGTQVLQEPPKSGFTLGLWLIPVVAILLGTGWLFYVMRGWANKDNAEPASPLPTTNGSSPEKGLSSSEDLSPDDYLSQVEKDLQT